MSDVSLARVTICQVTKIMEVLFCVDQLIRANYSPYLINISLFNVSKFVLDAKKLISTKVSSILRCYSFLLPVRLHSIKNTG